MHKQVCRKPLLVSLLLLWLLPGFLTAEEPKQLDVRVLIDVSGSMKRNDPKNLRRPALRLLSGLLPTGMQAGVWIFDRDVAQIAPLQAVDENWREEAIQGSDKIHSSGQFTHIEGALQVAVGDWYQAASEQDRHLILLTDGVVDVSHTKADSKASRGRILGDILPDLLIAGARVHTIALSSRADRKLLKRMSEETGGLHESIGNASRLQRVFLKLFEQAGKPDAIPLKGNTFQVDAGIKEATIILFRGRKSAESRLIDPDGNEYSEKIKPDTIRWHLDQGFELITIGKPKPGEWRVVADMDPDNRVMVVTDLKMHLAELPALVLAKGKTGLSAHFTDRGEKMTDADFVKLVTVRGDLSGRKADPLAFSLEPGSGGSDFIHALAMPDKPGRYELVVTGKSETFSRERRHQFEVREAVKTSREDQPELVKVRIRIDADLLANAEISASLQAGGQEMRQMVLPLQENRYEVEVSPLSFTGKGELQLAIKGEHRGAEVVIRPDPESIMGAKQEPEPEPESKPEPEPKPPAEPETKPELTEAEPEAAPPEPPAESESEEGSGLMGWLVFAGSNLLLLLLLAGGWMFWKKRRSANDLELLDDDEQEE